MPAHTQAAPLDLLHFVLEMQLAICTSELNDMYVLNPLANGGKVSWVNVLVAYATAA